MKKFFVAVFLSVGLLVTLGCSSTPPGTLSVGEVIEKEAELLGQNIVVVGMSETSSSMAKFNMFKIYHQKDNVLVKIPEMLSMPPQREKIRVSGKLDRNKLKGVEGEALYIEATDVSLE